MPFINVDRDRLYRAAAAIDNYINRHKGEMLNANNEINTLAGAWQGSDFNQFRSGWSRVTEKDSTSDKMITSLENYAKFLRFASGKYKVAQTNAIFRANGIK